MLTHRYLIIWDADGCILDSANVMSTAIAMLKNTDFFVKHQDLDNPTTFKKFYLNPKNQKNPENAILYQTVAESEKLTTLVPDIQDVLKTHYFEQCIVSRATNDQHARKLTNNATLLKYISIEKHFLTNDNQSLKDTFMQRAMENLHYGNEHCIAIGDSPDDIDAAIRCGIKHRIGFVGVVPKSKKEQITNELKKQGATYVAQNPLDLKLYLERNFSR